MPFLDKFRVVKVGLIPLTLALSLRSSHFNEVFLHSYMIEFYGWISILLSKTVSRLEFVLIKLINLAYLVKLFLSLTSGEDKDSFLIEEVSSLSKIGSRTSLPSLQLFKISSLIDWMVVSFIGFSKLHARFRD